jgi:tripartite-type tricarboxylate transporter receptor subunit TctC
MPPAISNSKAGKLRALAVTTPKRVAAAPEVPTMIEAGLPSFEIVLYSGILGPKGMDRSLVRRLNAEFAKAVQSAEMQPVWQNLGADPIVMTPDEFEAATAREIAKLAPVVKASGAKLE